jgi:glutathione synthase/RimK-type ligase-like ATP-grasp enzyme
VDLKQVGNKAVVIEVNDNPSIDAGVEDAHLGDTLYVNIMREFLRRMERKRQGLTS